MSFPFFCCSKKLADIYRQFFFQIDEPLGNVLGDFIGSFVLIEIFVERLDPHVAAVSHQIRDGVIGFIHDQLHVRFHPGHSCGDGVGILAIIVIFVQQTLNFTIQFVVFVLAVRELFLQFFRFDVFQHLVNGFDSHLYTRVALAEKSYRILFDHACNLPFFFISLSEREGIMKDSENFKDYAGVPKLSGAAKKYYRTYKKLFDEFSAKNSQNNSFEFTKQDENIEKSVTRADDENASVTDDNTKNTGERARYALKMSTEGTHFVEVDSFAFTDKSSPKEIAEVLSEIVRTKFSDFIKVDGQTIGINQRTAREWVRSKSATTLLRYSRTAFIDKANAFENADELLKVARNYISETRNHSRDDNFVGFARGIVDFKVKTRGYEADIIVGTTKSGAAILYDLVNIKGKKIVADASNATQSRRSDAPTTNNSITENAEKINPSDKNSSKKSSKKFAIPETDSEGTALSDGQRRYFEHTKQLDSKGNLQVMYQGAAEDFQVFDRKRSKASNLYGRGFYFTNSDAQAGHYGNTRAFYLNVTEPLSTTEKTITRMQMRKFLNAVAKNEDYSIENYGTYNVDEVLSSVYSGKSDFAMLQDVSATAIGDLVEATELFNEINGTNFDGFILDSETVIFRSEQAKLTSNKAPTKNVDIRYAFDDSEVDNSNEKSYTYTKEQYEKFGWARANDVLSKKENACLRSLFADAVSKQANPPRTKFGEYMIEIGDDVHNKIAYMTGEIDNPTITRVLEIAEYDETVLSKRREEIYVSERRGIREKTGGVYRRYSRADYGYKLYQQRVSEQSIENNNQLGVERGTGGRATEATQGDVSKQYLPIVDTFTDVSGKKRNVLKVGKEYMIEGNTHAKYSPTIEDVVKAENARIINRYAKKYNKSAGWVKQKLSADPNFLKAERDSGKRYAISDIEATRKSIVTNIEQAYKPTFKDNIFSGWTALKIGFVDEFAGVEAVGKAYGIKDTPDRGRILQKRPIRKSAMRGCLIAGVEIAARARLSDWFTVQSNA